MNKWINNESAECVLPHGQFIMLSLLICLEIDFFHGVQIICIATGAAYNVQICNRGYFEGKIYKQNY